jgi:lysophospholipid acyltransferase (LPLAT)-like uncharacterized protein
MFAPVLHKGKSHAEHDTKCVRLPKVIGRPTLSGGVVRDLGLASAIKFQKTIRLTTPDTSSPSSPAPRVHAILGWRRTLLTPLAWLVRLWGATLRFEASPEAVKYLSKTDVPLAMMVWHNRLFLGSELFRRYRKHRPVYCLISASKDGAWIDAYFSLVGMHSVRGSSSKLGREAVTALVAVMKAGHDIAITADGPRGPRYDFKPGGVIVARRAHVPMLLIGGEFSSAWQLGSWDGFYLPRPFSRVRVSCELIGNDELGDRDACIERLRARLIAINPDGGGKPASH